MPESTTNIFSMAPPVSVKTTDSIGGKSTFSGDARSDNQSSFSSKLSDAEDQQRGSLAESDRTEKKFSPGRKPESNSDVDEKAETGTSTSISDSAVGRLKPNDAESSGVTKSGAPLTDTLEALSGVSEGLYNNEEMLSTSKPEISLETVDGSNLDQARELGLKEEMLSTSKPEVSIETVDGSNLDQTRELGFLENSDEGLSVKSLIEDTQVPTALGNTLTDTVLKDAAEPEITVPIAGLATGAVIVDQDKAAATPTTVSPGRNSAVPSGPLTQNVSTPLASVPVAEVEIIDKRLGRLSSTIEPLEISQTGSAIALGESKNSKNIDASVMSLRNQALGLDGEQVLNQSIQLRGPTAVKGEVSKGILISDLTLPKEASLAVSDTQATLAGTRAQPPELSPVQIVTQLNQSTAQAETIPAGTIGSNSDLAKGLSVAAAVDHMLAATSGGIVTAPTQVRADLVNSQSVNAPLHAPLNVPLLASSASEVLSGNIRWMVGEGIQTATVSVTPSGMGPITIQIGVEKEQMSISIVATQGSTREALEATIPRLREQLGTQGLESVRVDISDGRSDQSKSNTSSDRQAMGGNLENSQDSSTENTNNENSSASFGNNNEQDSGERILSDTERELLFQLQELSSDPSVAQSTIRHGYDLYV